MKNVHLLPTENYKQDYTTMRGEVIEVVRLGQLILNKETGELLVNKNPQWAASCDTDILVPHHIYITSDEEIKHEDWYLTSKNTICKCIKTDSKYVYSLEGGSSTNCKKIILTTDQDLIAEGVQNIDGEFLEWLVKNPSCEFVDVKLNSFGECHFNDCSCFDIADQKVCVFHYPDYKVVIPQEEPKQENCTFCNGTGQIVSSTTISGFKTCDCIIISQEEPKHISTKPFLDNADEVIVIHRPKQELPAYKLISNYYGQSKTKRSGIPLINHIDEGIEILKGIGADEDTIEAYCLHPLLQSDEEFNKNLNMDFSKVSTSALILAVEYRRVANSYLSTNKMEDFVGFTNEKIKQMLYADKIQNEKDFALYHEGKHERSKELREYFNNWLNILLK